MRYKSKAKCLTVTLVAILLTGCKGYNQADIKTSEFFAMDTYISISAYGENADNALDNCRKEIKALDSGLSVTNADSEIYRINQSAGKAVSLSDDAAKIINAALELSEKTKGALDISLYPVIKEWGFTTGEYKIPSENALSELLKNTGYEKISCDDTALTLPEGFQIDLGSVAKGYGSDRAIQILKEKGIASALVNLGGNIALLGSKPDGSAWSVGVQNPFGEGYACIVKAKDKFIVTSGNYQRYFEENGKRYCHIIDPKTGCPVDNGLASVTVIGGSGLICDGLSTALFVMGEEEAIAFWREQEDFEMIMVTEDKRVLVTEGIFKDCSLSELGELDIIEK